MRPEVSASYRMKSEDVSAERVDGDVIAVNLETGAYFSLSGSSADVWTAATSGAPAALWLRSLDDAYLCTVDRDHVAEMLAACLRYGLLEEAPSTSSQTPTLPDDSPRLGWAEPHVDVFTDLQDLLLLDPIHDATDLGWPQAASLDD